jgi:hypothetical protein
MTELEQKEQFEDAIQMGLRSRTGRPSDYFIYQMVAQAYAIREYKDPKQSAQWAELAAQYAEKALSADPNDLSNIFNVGQTYELAGNNLLTSDSCRYFQRAVFRAEDVRRFVAIAPPCHSGIQNRRMQTGRVAHFWAPLK